MANLAPEEKKTEYITKKKTKRKPGPASELGKKEPEIRFIMVDEDGKLSGYEKKRGKAIAQAMKNKKKII